MSILTDEFPVRLHAANKHVFTDPHAFGLTMVVVVVDHFGLEALDWDPETILMEIERDFQCKIPLTNFDRLMAAISVIKSDSFYRSLPDFIDICNILSGSPASPDVFDPADTVECAWGITEALLLFPPDTQNPFSEEICAYIAAMLDEEGIITPPDVLRIATRVDLRPQIHGQYSDDPELYAAIWAVEKDKTDDINSLVKERLHLLVQQLSSLQLKVGAPEQLARKLLAGLTKVPE